MFHSTQGYYSFTETSPGKEDEYEGLCDEKQVAYPLGAYRKPFVPNPEQEHFCSYRIISLRGSSNNVSVPKAEAESDPFSALEWLKSTELFIH